MNAEEAADLTESIRLEASGAMPLNSTAFYSMAEFVACDLATLEAVVDEGLETFVRVGLALMAIRERRLYLASHQTFDAYCRDRWGMVYGHVADPGERYRREQREALAAARARRKP